MTDVVVELQDSLRSELKTPIGPIFTDTDELLAAAGTPLVTVGDVVTYHVIEAGHTPDVALVDDRTERSDVDPEIADVIASFQGFDTELTVENPAATLTIPIIRALKAALETPAESTLIEVDGEEDLAALPAILLAPPGTTIVYGQPGEGMVAVRVDAAVKSDIADLIEQMKGDPQKLFDLLEYTPE